MDENWRQYQEDAAAFFRTLGLTAETNFRVDGVRTCHDIDVFVTSVRLGFQVKWVVECKAWNSKVPKGHVLLLRSIVTEIGADRGILLSESGFQSGAIETAHLSNIHLSNLTSLKESARAEIFALRHKDLLVRYQACKSHYWDIPKDERIAAGLRSGEGGYSGTLILMYLEELIARSAAGNYPIIMLQIRNAGGHPPGDSFSNPEEVLHELELLISELEHKLSAFPQYKGITERMLAVMVSKT